MMMHGTGGANMAMCQSGIGGEMGRRANRENAPVVAETGLWISLLLRVRSACLSIVHRIVFRLVASKHTPLTRDILASRLRSRARHHTPIGSLIIRGAARRISARESREASPPRALQTQTQTRPERAVGLHIR